MRKSNAFFFLDPSDRSNNPSRTHSKLTSRQPLRPRRWARSRRGARHKPRARRTATRPSARPSCRRCPRRARRGQSRTRFRQRHCPSFPREQASSPRTFWRKSRSERERGREIAGHRSREGRKKARPRARERRVQRGTRFVIGAQYFYTLFFLSFIAFLLLDLCHHRHRGPLLLLAPVRRHLHGRRRSEG